MPDNVLNLLFEDSDIYGLIPITPKNLTVTDSQSTTINVDWDDVADADSYILYYKKSSSETPSLITNVLVSNHQITGLDSVEEYEIWVVSVKNNVKSFESNHVTQATVDSQPPTLPNTQLGTSSITQNGWIVDFTAASDNVDDHADITYTLYISDGNNLDTIANIKANGTEVSSQKGTTALGVSGLSASETKWFNIIAKDLSGNEVAYTQNSETTVGDVTAPTPTISISQTSPTNESLLNVTINWDEEVQNFTLSDVTVSSGTKQNFVPVSASQYTFDIALVQDGQVNIDIPAGVCQDLNGNNNNAATQASIVYDGTAPTPVITSTENSPTAADPIPAEVDFGEVVNNFVVGDITAQGATISNFSTVDNQVWTFNINPSSSQETILIDIAAAVATDNAGNPNNAATQFEIVHDTSGPIPTISSTSSDPTAISPIPVEVDFNEAVQNFVEADITVTNGTIAAGTFTQISQNRYIFDVTPASDGLQVAIDINAGVCTDLLGNNNVAAAQFTRFYDTTVPTVNITSSSSSPTNDNPITATFTFSEAVTGFTIDDPVVVGGTKSNFVIVSSTVYTVDITPNSTQENITIDVPQNSAQDLAGTGNTAATQFSITYDAVRDKPVITSSEATYTQATLIPITVTFPEAQIGFDLTDIVVGNGTKGTFVDVGGGVYTFNLTPTANGACTVDIDPNVCTDQAGNNNLGADQFTIFHDTASPTVSNAAFLAESNITTSGFNANWRKATDAVSDQVNLVYKLYSSLSANIDTVSNILANGTFEVQGTDVTTLAVTGYNEGDQVYYNVICEDQAGNQLAYIMDSQVIADNTPPTVLSPGLSTEEVFEYSYDVVFEKSEDNVTLQTNLVYRLYTSTQANLNDKSTIVANGTLQDEGTDVIRLTADVLESDTLYYHNVVVDDGNGNISIYDMGSQKTAKFGDAVLSQTQLF